MLVRSLGWQVAHKTRANADRVSSYWREPPPPSSVAQESLDVVRETSPGDTHDWHDPPARGDRLHRFMAVYGSAARLHRHRAHDWHDTVHLVGAPAACRHSERRNLRQLHAAGVIGHGTTNPTHHDRLNANQSLA